MIILILLALLPVPSKGVSANDSQPTVIFGGDASYPPFHFINEQGLLAGFDVELVEAIAKTIGFKAEFKLGDWSAALDNLEHGIVDVVPMFIPAKSALHYDVSRPYTMRYHLIYGHEKSLSIEGIEQLAGKEVILRRAGYAAEALQEAGVNVFPFFTNSAPEILNLLTSG